MNPAPTKPLCIGLVTPSWPGQTVANGITTAVGNLVIGLTNLGHRVVILTKNRDGAPGDVRVVEIGGTHWNLRQRLAARIGFSGVVYRVVAQSYADAVAKAADHHDLDIVIMEETQGWVGQVARATSVPVVAALHGPWILLHKHASLGSASRDAYRIAQEGRALARVAGLLAPSQAVLGAIHEAFPTVTAPSAVVPNSLAAKAVLDRQQKGAEPVDILFVGRFDRLKGADVVLETFSRIAATRTKTRLTLVGPDPGLRMADGRVVRAEDAIAALPAPVRQRVRFLGRLDKDKVSELRQTHPIALIASRFENFSYTLLEAAAAGQALVCTAVGGQVEALVDAQTALLVPPDDPAAMAAALDRLIGDPALAARIGAQAHQDVLTRFSPDIVAEQTVDFLREVIARAKV